MTLDSSGQVAGFDVFADGAGNWMFTGYVQVNADVTTFCVPPNGLTVLR